MMGTSVGVVGKPPVLRCERVQLRPLAELDGRAWRRLHTHFRDPEIAHLNGTPPSRMPLWLLRRVLRADASRPDRRTFGIFDEREVYIGTVELYDLRSSEGTLGIIIGERSHWGRGYGTEAVRGVLAYAFGELGLERVRLHTYGDNDRAQAAFRKVGFVEQRRAVGTRGRVDVHMALVRSAWFHHLGHPPVDPPATGTAAAAITTASTAATPRGSAADTPATTAPATAAADPWS